MTASPVRRWIAASLTLLTMAMAVGSVALTVLNLSAGVPFDWTSGQILAEITLGTGFTIVGGS